MNDEDSIIRDSIKTLMDAACDAMQKEWQARYEKAQEMKAYMVQGYPVPQDASVIELERLFSLDSPK